MANFFCIMAIYIHRFFEFGVYMYTTSVSLSSVIMCTCVKTYYM